MTRTLSLTTIVGDGVIVEMRQGRGITLTDVFVWDPSWAPAMKGNLCRREVRLSLGKVWRIWKEINT